MNADFTSDYLDRPGVRITRHPRADGAKLNLIVAAGPETATTCDLCGTSFGKGARTRAALGGENFEP